MKYSILVLVLSFFATRVNGMETTINPAMSVKHEVRRATHFAEMLTQDTFTKQTFVPTLQLLLPEEEYVAHCADTTDLQYSSFLGLKARLKQLKISLPFDFKKALEKDVARFEYSKLFDTSIDRIITACETDYAKATQLLDPIIAAYDARNANSCLYETLAMHYKDTAIGYTFLQRAAATGSAFACYAIGQKAESGSYQRKEWLLKANTCLNSKESTKITRADVHYCLAKECLRRNESEEAEKWLYLPAKSDSKDTQTFQAQQLLANIKAQSSEITKQRHGIQDLEKLVEGPLKNDSSCRIMLAQAYWKHASSLLQQGTNSTKALDCRDKGIALLEESFKQGDGKAALTLAQYFHSAAKSALPPSPMHLLQTERAFSWYHKAASMEPNTTTGFNPIIAQEHAGKLAHNLALLHKNNPAKQYEYASCAAYYQEELIKKNPHTALNLINLACLYRDGSLIDPKKSAQKQEAERTQHKEKARLLYQQVIDIPFDQLTNENINNHRIAHAYEQLAALAEQDDNKQEALRNNVNALTCYKMYIKNNTDALAKNLTTSQNPEEALRLSQLINEANRLCNTVRKNLARLYMANSTEPTTTPEQAQELMHFAQEILKEAVLFDDEGAQKELITQGDTYFFAKNYLQAISCYDAAGTADSAYKAGCLREKGKENKEDTTKSVSANAIAAARYFFVSAQKGHEAAHKKIQKLLETDAGSFILGQSFETTLSDLSAEKLAPLQHNQLAHNNAIGFYMLGVQAGNGHSCCKRLFEYLAEHEHATTRLTPDEITQLRTYAANAHEFYPENNEDATARAKKIVLCNVATALCEHTSGIKMSADKKSYFYRADYVKDSAQIIRDQLTNIQKRQYAEDKDMKIFLSIMEKLVNEQKLATS